MSVRLTAGIQVAMGDTEYVISNVDHAAGSVRLRPGNGPQITISLEDFINHPRLSEAGPNALVIHDDAVDRLDPRMLTVLHKRIAHVYEAETGYRSGSSALALPHEPLPHYDPAATTLTERRKTKAAELDNEHAADAGTKMSYATLRRVGKALASGQGLSGAVDHRLVRRSPGRTSINTQVHAACEHVFEHTRLKSNVTHEGRYNLVCQYMRATFGTDKDVPVERTIRRWFEDRFIPSELNGKARTRRSATTAPTGGFNRPNPTRPGELVCIDTCSLDVLLEGTEFAGVVRGVIVMAVDWYSRSVVAIRVLQDAEQALDVTFLLREIARPKSMLPGWSEDLRWPFVGVPESILTEVFGGQEFSGMPFVTPEAVVPDHGSTYKAHINVATARQQGISILPARVRTGSDKQVIERTFGSLKTMLLQYLSGYRGSDVSERGQNTDAEVKYSLQDIEDLACWWAVRVWQNHVLSDARPDWCPEGEFSPNTLYEYGLAQTGMPLKTMSSYDYYSSLPCVTVKVHSRGVHVKGLWYDDQHTGVLDNLRNVPSTRGGVGKGTWTVRYDKRDLRRVFILDSTGTFHPLTWIGATPHTPCFNDKHAKALTRLRIERGISAASHESLADILLTEILAVHEPVESWPTLPKGVLKQISRRKRQEEMAARDQTNHDVETFKQANADRRDLDEFDRAATESLNGGTGPQPSTGRVPARPARTATEPAHTAPVSVPEPLDTPPQRAVQPAQPASPTPPAGLSFPALPAPTGPVEPADGIAPSSRLDGGTALFGFDPSVAAAIHAARAAHGNPPATRTQEPS